MKTSQLAAFGKAADVLSVRDVPDARPGPGEILLEMLAAVVNPADLNIIEGKYGELPALPAVIGNEGVGRVVELGPGAEGFEVGDIVLPMRPGAWTQLLVADAAEAVRLPAGIDIRQAAMLSVNPPSAWGMLEDFVALNPGEWIVQNAANSAVGRCVIQIARARGLKTLNVVRRPELIEELQAAGGDAVVLEDVDLRSRAGELCGGTRPRLALNAVGGASALNLANAVADLGVIVTYGAMGRQPLKIPNGLLIFRNLSFRGFWLKRWRANASREKLQRTLGELAALSLSGRLHMPVHRVYPFDGLIAAVAEAGAEARSGKVLIDLQNKSAT